MTFTLLDYLQYNNINYSELPDGEDKDKLKRFAKKLEEENLKELILSFTPAHKFNPRHFEHSAQDFISGLPQDLTNKMMLLWVNLNDPEYHLPSNKK
jgi:hypothetical protein